MGIITRLQSLQETAEAASEPMQRYFELTVFQKGEKPNTFPFDNIDMISIEIFELLQ
jgi:uncharacterized protein YkuJ